MDLFLIGVPPNLRLPCPQRLDYLTPTTPPTLASNGPHSDLPQVRLNVLARNFPHEGPLVDPLIPSLRHLCFQVLPSPPSRYYQVRHPQLSLNHIYTLSHKDSLGLLKANKFNQDNEFRRAFKRCLLHTHARLITYLCHEPFLTLTPSPSRTAYPSLMPHGARNTFIRHQQYFTVTICFHIFLSTRLWDRILYLWILSA